MAVFAGFAALAASDVSSFVAAAPVWPEGRTMEGNAFVGFRADFAVRKGERPVLRVTGSSLYRAWVNGKFAGYGPARAGHGYFRVDEWPLDGWTHEGTNAVAIEVKAYGLFRNGINSIAVQPGFVEAEVTVGDDVRCATGRDFTCVDIPHARKVSRWSPHRGQIDAYRLGPGWDVWRTESGFRGTTPARLPSVRLLERIVSYPDFRILPGRTVSATSFAYDAARAPAHPDLEFDAKDVSDRLSGVKTTPLPTGTDFAPVASGKGVIADFGGVHAGFCGLTVRCREPGVLWVFVDEMPMHGLVDPVKRTRYASAFVCQLTAPGEYRLEAFEATALGVVHAFMTSGSAEVGGFFIREYANPDVRKATFGCSDPVLECIFAAAQETCAQNTMDAQMDCPSRERMSCPCDGHYTLAGCNLLAGHHAVERLFFDCFCHSTNYCSHVPGRLPGMYPNSSGPGGTASIPNWNMFMALQLERYVRETGDRCSAEALKAKLLETMETLERSRNADGLLENVPGWVFVSWDRSNGSTKGVNYPTNMLWAEALDAVARLYGVREYAEEAAHVRDVVRARGWDGTWFRDCAADGTTTETCQAYAFRFGIATPTSHPALWRKFVDELGPCRAKGAHPSVPPSETFIGAMLRLEALMAAGEHRAALRDVKGYFRRMAETTGTLWEGLDPYAQNMLSHGFNSFVAVSLAECALGVRAIDGVGKRVDLRVPDNGLESCRGEFPTPDGPLRYSWRRRDGKVTEEVVLPPGWKRTEPRSVPASRPRIAEVPSAAEIGRPFAPWKVGELDLHFVYTGTGENQFWIFPDGTTAVCDTGDYNNAGLRGRIPLLPSGARTGGEWMARYMKAVSPAKDTLDYMLVSHWHSDHAGELKYAYATPDGRKTSGLATVGEFFKVGTFFDHQYPELNRYGVGEAHVAKMVRDYVARAKARDGTRQEPFRVGALNQIALRHDPEGKYAGTFEVRNLCANGVAWTGEGEASEDLLAAHIAQAGAKGFDENTLSLGVIIRYGNFRYFSAGDANRVLKGADGKAYDYESRLAAVAGPVDVAKVNHHAWKWTMPVALVKSLSAAAYLINVWDDEHLQPEQMERMCSTALYPGERFVFPTLVTERMRRMVAGKPSERCLSRASGHVVVRVAPGGATYRIYVLDATDERRIVRAAYAGESGRP